MTRTPPWLAVPAAGLLALVACADPDAEQPDPPFADVDWGDQRYEVAATVLESPDHGPQLCSGVDDSYPPQCGGPDVVGWDWELVAHESAHGTTWGEYALVGTWDGERFKLTEPPLPYDGIPAPEPAQEPDHTSPCPEPEGGWRPVDPATATEQALDEALARAQSAPEYAGAWFDQSYLDELDGAPREEVANDPARLVLNLRFTGDLEQREQWIREVWGGALCVSAAEHTETELLDIQQRLHEQVPDLLSSGQDVVSNAVRARVFLATPELQAEIDDRFGTGTVILEDWLRPVD